MSKISELIIDINSNMQYQTGNMRDINNDHSPYKNSISWQRENQFQYAQRSKYQKSEASYLNNQKSKVIYEQEKSDRISKANQNNQVSVTLPIKIKSTEREDYVASFKIQLLSVVDKNNNCLTMHITNDNDSLFLWSFFVRETQFLNLKNQQSLKVDFHGFPEVIIEHLNYCSNYQKESKNPIFYAVLDIKKGSQQAELKIIQANKYKQSLHLSLKFKKANDEQQKVYLAHKFDRQRKQNARLSNQLMQAQHKLNIRMQQLEKIHAEFQQMERQKGQKIGQLERREREKIKQTTLRLQQQNIRKQKSETQKNTRQLNELNNKIQELKSKNEQLFSNYQKANERIINLQASESTLKSKCSMLQQQNQSYEKSNKELKTKELKHNEQFHTLKNQNTKLSCMIQSLEDKIKQRDHRLNQNSEVKSNNYNQISALQESLRQEKQKVVKLEQKNEVLETQISKLQKKSEDLFNKYQKKKDKFNDYKQILTLQEQKIESYQKQERKMLEEIVQLKRDLQKSELETKDRDLKIKDLKTHIEQNLQYIEDQKKMISELHKRINQKSIGTKNLPIPSSLPLYTGFSASGTIGTIGRDFSSTISSTSQSRIKYSPSPISTSPILDKPSERIAPPFRKYRQGIQNDKDQENSYHSQHSHSRSPIVNKLSQQMDPEETDRTKEKIGPIKFKRQL